MPIRITIWNEGLHEVESEAIRKVYPEGIHGAIAGIFAGNPDFTVRTATLREPECGLTDEVLADTDVFFWWGHAAHDQVPDALARKVQQAVLKGAGFIALHSAHFSKPLLLLTGTSNTLRWRNDDRERLWTVNPAHPIAAGLPEFIELPHEEMYGEPFDIPEPDETVFMGWFAGGEVFRSGVTYRRGYGKVFYFQPGHEEYPVYYDENIRKILRNAAYWAAPSARRGKLSCVDAPPAPEKR